MIKRPELNISHVSGCDICKCAGWIDRPLTLSETEYRLRWNERWYSLSGDWDSITDFERTHFRIAEENLLASSSPAIHPDLDPMDCRDSNCNCREES